MITALVASTAFAFLAQTTSPILTPSTVMPPPSVRIAQWCTYETTLKATDTHEAPDSAQIVLAEQTLPNPVQTKAVEGTVLKSDEAAGRVIGRAVDAIAHGVPRKSTTDPFDGFKEGAQVIVHDVAHSGVPNPALEADHIGANGSELTEGRVEPIAGRVTHIDRGKKELTIELEDGSKEKLQLTERADKDAHDAAAAGTQVIVSYTDAAGQSVVEMFRRIR
jgi:hypothetical protein